LQHKLSNKNADTRTADCSVCGPGIKANVRKRRGNYVEFDCLNRRNELRNSKDRRDSKNTQRAKSKGMLIDCYRTTYDELFLKQDGKCGICERDLITARRVHMDHDHATGSVRGLLCHNCNCGIGLLGDTKEAVLKAAAYLK